MGHPAQWRWLTSRRKIIRMRESNEKWLAFSISLALAMLTTIPYWVAANQVEPGHVFSGFLINPIDGFSYLAKMQQGREGWWTFALPYSPEPGPRVFLFSYHLMLGRIAGLMRLPNILIYHAARFIFSILMFYSAFLLYQTILTTRRLVWTAFTLTAIGSGLGWIGVIFGLMAIDLWVPEAIPFLTAYANAHFPLAAAIILLAVRFFFDPKPKLILRFMTLVICGFTLAAIQPVVVLSLALVFFCWLLIETFLRKRQGQSLLESTDRDRYAIFAGFCLGSSPLILYQYVLTRTHPTISIWNQQNITPTPPLIEVLFGFGIILILAVIGIVAQRLQKIQSGRLLIIWALVGGVLLYLPFPLQRRFLMGLFFPLSCLAAYGIQSLSLKTVSFKAIVLAVLILAIPSNLFVLTAGLSTINRSESLLVIDESEKKAYEWAVMNLPSQSLLLIGPRGGNRIPAFGNLRVLFGHPFETPGAEQQRALVEELYSEEVSDKVALLRLSRLGVDYVFLGAEEKNIGFPSWMKSLPEIYQEDGIAILEVVPE
jgi:hypothetical protein